eukprot:6486019-Amphidinium_carterae.1
MALQRRSPGDGLLLVMNLLQFLCAVMVFMDTFFLFLPIVLATLPVCASCFQHPLDSGPC